MLLLLWWTVLQHMWRYENLHIRTPKTVSNWSSLNLLKFHNKATPLDWNFGSAAWLITKTLQNQHQNINISYHKAVSISAKNVWHQSLTNINNFECGGSHFALMTHYGFSFVKFCQTLVGAFYEKQAGSKLFWLRLLFFVNKSLDSCAC